jgi:hypothetical protein
MVPALSCVRKIHQEEQNRRLISEMSAVLHFRMRGARRGRLPKLLMLYIDPAPWGHVAEWLRNGLQNRVHQFNSGRGLHQYNQCLALIIGETGRRRAPRNQQTAYQPSGKGMSGQASWLSFAALGGSLNIGGWAKKSSCGAGAMAVLTASSNRSNSTSLIVRAPGSRAHGLKSLLFPD